MTSNLLSPITEEIVRDTFGIKEQKTGKPYHDILTAFLQLRYITDKDLDNGFIFENPAKEEVTNTNDLFFLHCDGKLRRLLQQKQEVQCIISFQIRTTGNFAIARIFTT